MLITLTSLWAEWCRTNLLKGKCFWEINPPPDCSWTWRKILKLREVAIDISKYIIGNGETISFWYANWHPIGPLSPKFGPRIAYDAAIPKNAKVSKVISNGQWKWPRRSTWELREVIIARPPSYMPNCQDDDTFEWMVSKNREYSAAATWEAIRVKAHKVPWHNLLWFSHHIPRHSLILWLAIRGRLSTKDRMTSWGISIDPLCVLCGQASESHDHLFFHCTFSAEIRGKILATCHITKAKQPWKDEISWAIGKFSGKGRDNLIGKLAWVALVYHIWQERNTRIFKGLSSSISTIVRNIMYEAKVKFYSCSK